MNQLPSAERPRERCLQVGAFALSLRECLAVLLGSGPRGAGCMGVASLILSRPGEGLLSAEQERAFFVMMESSSGSGLDGIRGLGPAGKARILTAFELGRRYANYRGKVETRSSTTASELAKEALSKIGNEERQAPREWLGFVPVHRDGKVGELCIVERGVRTHVNVDPAELFARVLSLRPRALFLAHNHPSGCTTPSTEDHHLTREVYEMASGFGISVLGHWIITPRSETWLELNS